MGTRHITVCLSEHPIAFGPGRLGVVFIFMATFDVPMLEACLEAIRLLSSGEVQDLAVQVLPLDQLPLDYLHQLGDDDRTTAYRASCLAWAVTGGTQVP